MSDSSGFSKLAGLLRFTAQTGRSTPGSVEAAGTAELVRAPEEVRSTDRPVRLRGRVTEQSRDPVSRETRVVIQTERGTVEVRLPPEQPPPQPGQIVEIEIPPRAEGQTRAQGAVQIQIITPQAPRSAPAAPASPQAPQPPTRTTATPVDVTLGSIVGETVPTERTTPQQPGPTADTQAALPPKTLPPPESIVRLLPVPARELPALLAQQSAPDIVTALLQPVLTTYESVVPVLIEQLSATAPTQQTTASVLLPPLQEIYTPAPPAGTSQAAPQIGPEAIAQTQAQSLKVFLSEPQPINTLVNNTTLSFIPTAGPVFIIPPAAEAPNITAPILTAQITQTSSPLQAFNARIIASEAPLPRIVVPDTIPNVTQTAKSNKVLSAQNPVVQNAVVIGSTPQNLPIISLLPSGPDFTSGQTFILQSPVQDLPIGTQIQIIPQGTGASPQIATAPHSALEGLPFSFAPAPWPIMDQLYQTLARIAPASAQAFSSIVPNAASPAQITPAALFFIAAIRSGEISNWLGEKAVEALRNSGRGGLLNRLTQETSMLNRLSADPVAQDWRGVSVPIFYEGGIQKLAIYYKQDGSSDQDAQDKGKTTRFIFDLLLDRMGKVQVDGLFRPGRLDLVVRTEDFLSQAMQMDMRRHYSDGMRQAGITGELSFQNQQEGWVTIQASGGKQLGVSA